MADNYQRVDLYRMVQRPRCAVMCRTAGDTVTFFYNVIEQFPNFVVWDLNNILNVWNNYQEKTGFTLMLSDDEPTSISYCGEEWFRNSGYEIIEFEVLANPVELEESEMPVDVLLNAG